MAVSLHSGAAVLNARWSQIFRRWITTADAQQKFLGRAKLGISDEFEAAKSEKLANRAGSWVKDRPAHLNRATSAVKSLAKRGSFDEAWTAYTEVLDPDGVLHSAALHLCARARWFERAASIWSVTPKDSLISFGTMIDACARCQRLAVAEQVFASIGEHRFEPDIIAYNSMINAFAMCGEPQRATRLFGAIPAQVFEGASEGNKQIGYLSTMMALARSSDYAGARHLFIEMTSKGIPPRNPHFSALLSACAPAGYAEIARGVFDLMPQYGLKPDVATWTCLLSCHRRDLSRCLRIVEEMRTEGVQPSSLTYQELLEAHVLAGDGRGARELLASQQGSLYSSTKVSRLMRAAAALP